MNELLIYTHQLHYLLHLSSCSLVQISSQPITRKTRSRRPAKGQIEHQTGEERGFKWLLVWQTDRLVCVFQKRLIYWDFQVQPSPEFTENGQKNTQWAVLWAKMPCWCKRSGLRRGKGNSTNRWGLQKAVSERATRPVLKQIGCSSRRLQGEPLLLAENRKLRL